MLVCTTARLTIRHLTTEDAPFIYTLLNEPSWLQYIGDKHIATLDDAKNYICTGPQAMIERCGYGLFLVSSKQDQCSLGLCGLISREGLDNVDIGFAFLPDYWRQGYAFEAAKAVLKHGIAHHSLTRIIGITSIDNSSSISLLRRLGFVFENTVQLPEDDETLNLYALSVVH